MGQSRKSAKNLNSCPLILLATGGGRRHRRCLWFRCRSFWVRVQQYIVMSIAPFAMTKPAFIPVTSKTINAKLGSPDEVPSLLHCQCPETRTLKDRVRPLAVWASRRGARDQRAYVIVAPSNLRVSCSFGHSFVVRGILFTSDIGLQSSEAKHGLPHEFIELLQLRQFI